MIQGVLHNNRPLIPLVIGWKQNIQDILVLIDTGFTGELKISLKRAKELGLNITHAEKVSLADDRQINMEASIALVSMEKTVNTVNVLISNGELPIIGVGLLKRFGYTLKIDFKHDILHLQKYSH